MIESNLEFEVGSLDRVLRAFLTLPETLRPTHESLGESEKKRPISDPEKFTEVALKRTPAPYLTNATCIYSISAPATKAVVCNCSLDDKPELAVQFLTHMAAFNPIFGFACDPLERDGRNRVRTQKGINKVESWVGRDPEKYIPGIYWLTLLPEHLLRKHGVPLSALEQLAKEHIELEGDQHLFRFYGSPEEWNRTLSVEKLCSDFPGIFYVERIRPMLEAAPTVMDLFSIARNWS